MSASILTVIVTYNGENYIEDCLRSLLLQTRKTDILVVDNASSDCTRQIIESNFPSVYVLDIGYNSGFAHANNVGIWHAIERGYDYVMLINEDTVSDKKLIETMLKYADNKTAVIPKIYMDRLLRKVWYAAGKIDFERRIAINCQEHLINQTTEVSFMTGCCMFIHTDIFRRVGTFDERFFMYYEDTDLSLRMYENGIRMLYVPDTYVWHRLQGKTDKPYYAYYMERNRLFFFKKHARAFKYHVWEILFDEIRRVYFHKDVYTAVFFKYKRRGLLDFIMNRRGKMVDR